MARKDSKAKAAFDRWWLANSVVCGPCGKRVSDRTPWCDNCGRLHTPMGKAEES